MGVEKKILSFRIDDEVIVKLKRLAKKENRSLSNLIETVLKKSLTEDKMKKILTAFELLTFIGEHLMTEIEQVKDIAYDSKGDERFFIVMENDEIFTVTVNRV